MQQTLYKYLLQHKKLVLPAVGSFVIEDEPASIDFANNTLVAPAQTIRFSHEYPAVAKNFYPFISADLKVSETAASQSFSEFIASIEAANNKVDLGEIGYLNRQFSNQFTYEPAYTLKSLLPNFSLEEKDKTQLEKIAAIPEPEVEITEETIVEEKKKKTWIIWAIIIAILSIAAIVANNFLTSPAL